MEVNKLLSVYKRVSQTELNRIKTNSLGALAKKRRISLHMTQGEVADKICSISYLSKVETNKIIPNDRCITALMEKVKISKWEIYTIENSKELIELAIKRILYNEIDEYSELYERVYDVETNQCADTIKIGYYLLNNNIKEAEKLIIDNINIASSMDRYVLSLFLYLTSVYLLKIGQFKELELIFKEEKTIYINDELDALYDELAFEYYSKIKRPVLTKEYYDNLIKLYKDRMIYQKIDDVTLKYALFLLKEDEYEKAIKACISLRKEEYFKQNPLYNYILGKSYYMIDKKITAKDYLYSIGSDSEYYPYIIEMKYDISKDKTQVYEEASQSYTLNQSFYLDYFMKKEAGLLSRKTFDSKEYNDLYSKADYYTKIDMLNKEQEYLIEQKKYKDAISIEKRKTKILK